MTNLLIEKQIKQKTFKTNAYRLNSIRNLKIFYKYVSIYSFAERIEVR